MISMRINPGDDHDDHRRQFGGVHFGTKPRGRPSASRLPPGPENFPGLDPAADHQEDENHPGPEGCAQMLRAGGGINLPGEKVKVNRQQKNQEGADQGFQGGRYLRAPSVSTCIPLPFSGNRFCFLRHGEKEKAARDSCALRYSAYLAIPKVFMKLRMVSTSEAIQAELVWPHVALGVEVLVLGELLPFGSFHGFLKASARILTRSAGTPFLATMDRNWGRVMS